VACGVAYTVACGVAYTVACGVAYTVVLPTRWCCLHGGVAYTVVLWKERGENIGKVNRRREHYRALGQVF